jgi:hypothetical protein
VLKSPKATLILAKEDWESLQGPSSITLDICIKFRLETLPSAWEEASMLKKFATVPYMETFYPQIYVLYAV